MMLRCRSGPQRPTVFLGASGARQLELALSTHARVGSDGGLLFPKCALFQVVVDICNVHPDSARQCIRKAERSPGLPDSGSDDHYPVAVVMLSLSAGGIDIRSDLWDRQVRAALAAAPSLHQPLVALPAPDPETAMVAAIPAALSAEIVPVRRRAPTMTEEDYLRLDPTVMAK
ncbi:unnamed protein product, partial [Prorocentrum cordatum]